MVSLSLALSLSLFPRPTNNLTYLRATAGNGITIGTSFRDGDTQKEVRKKNSWARSVIILRKEIPLGDDSTSVDAARILAAHRSTTRQGVH